MGWRCHLHEFQVSSFAIVDQNTIDGNHLIGICTLHDQGNVIISHSLIDCGTTGYAFRDKECARHHHLPLHLLKSPRNLTIMDGRPVTTEVIMQITHTNIVIGNHQEYISLFVTKLGHFPIVLGIP
jgi:predicted aspartyl protease